LPEKGPRLAGTGHPAAILYADHGRVAFFAYAQGRDVVHGLAIVGAGARTPSVTMTYTTSPGSIPHDRDRATYWARWIIHRAWTVVLGQSAKR
jgi:hypothetical protein